MGFFMDTTDGCFMKMSRINTLNRQKLKNPHTVGKTSFALVRHEKQKETSDTLSLKDIFVATRTRKSGRTYKCSDEDTTAKIANMESIETQQNENDESINAFESVTGPQHSGRLRLYGRGVTKTSLKGKVGAFEPSLNSATDHQLEDKIQRILAEKLAEEKRIMEEKFEERTASMRQEVVAQVLVQLQRSGVQFDANAILATLVSSGEASSAQRPSVDPIHRLSTGSNYEKQHIAGNPLRDEDRDSDEHLDCLS